MPYPPIVYAAQCVRLTIGVADAFQQSCFHAKSSRGLFPGRCQVFQWAERVVLLHHLWQSPLLNPLRHQRVHIIA